MALRVSPPQNLKTPSSRSWKSFPEARVRRRILAYPVPNSDERPLFFAGNAPLRPPPILASLFSPVGCPASTSLISRCVLL